jgi:hypothetical protein
LRRQTDPRHRCTHAPGSLSRAISNIIVTINATLLESLQIDLPVDPPISAVASGCSQVVATCTAVDGYRRTLADDGRVVETLELKPTADAQRQSRTLADTLAETAS